MAADESRENFPRSAIAALLAAVALHLALIAAATVWLAGSSKSNQRAPALIVVLHSAVAAASMATAAPQASSRELPPRAAAAQRKKARLPAVAMRPVPDSAATMPHPSKTPPPITPSTPSASAPEAAPAPAAAPSPIAAKTAVTISAAFAARNRKPDYPLMSRRYNEQGTAVLRILVAADGTAGEVQIKQSSGYPLLDQAALAAAQKWHFVAATQDGKPFAEWYEISIPYTLQD